MNYGAQIWGQNLNENVKRVIKVQDKSIRIINFANYQEPVSKLYQKSQILKFADSIKLNNYLYVHNSLNRKLPPCLQDNFQYLHDLHNHTTRNSEQHCVKLPKSYTLSYGIHSVNGQAARAWNYFQITFHKLNLHLLSRGCCKSKLTTSTLASY